ncbi:MAG: hypothetical protein SFV15_17310 [Polyangiaceae bacterium]|nr:hypothetical protein [Polyangiaceae bacterium]
MASAPITAVPGARNPAWTLLRIFLFAGAACIVFLFVTNQASNEEIIAVLPWLCVAVALQLLPIFTTRSGDLFSPPSWTGLKDGFDLIVIIVGVFAAQRIELGPLSALSTATRIDLTQQVAMLQITSRGAYLLGYFWPINRGLATRFPDLTARAWRPTRLLFASLILASIFVFTYAQFQSRLGGDLWDITRLREGKAVWRDDVTMTWMTRGVQFGFLPVILLFLYSGTTRSRAALVTSGLLFLVVAFFANRLGQRGPAVAVGAALLMLFHYTWRRVPLASFVGLLLIALVTTNVLGTFRSSERVDTTFEDEFSARISKPGDAMAEHATDRARLTAQAAVLYYFPDKRSYLLGESWEPLATLLIPKWIWPEKHDGELWTDTRIVPRLIGVLAPVSFPTMLYANFSWIGVFLCMYLWGVFHANLYAWHTNASVPSTAMLYVLTLVVFTPTFLGISGALQFVLPMLLLLRFVTVKRHTTPAENRRNTPRTF